MVITQKVCPFCKQRVSDKKFLEIEKNIKNELQHQFDKRYKEIEDRNKDLQKQFRDLKERERTLTTDIQKKVEAKVRDQWETHVKNQTKKLEERERKIEEEKQRMNQSIQSAVSKSTAQLLAKVELAHRREQGYLTKIEGLQRQLQRQTLDELGGISEEKLYELLKTTFKDDKVEHITKRASGGDILLTVCYNGKECTRILFENKNVQNWSSEWIKKIKEDAESHNTHYAILVSNVFPKGIRFFSIISGVIVIHPTGVEYVTKLIREGIVALEQRNLSEEEKDEKMAELYKYILSEEFKVAIASIFAAAKNLDDIRRTERRQHENIWSKQENEVKSINTNVTKIITKFQIIAERKKKKVLTIQQEE